MLTQCTHAAVCIRRQEPSSKQQCQLAETNEGKQLRQLQLHQQHSLMCVDLRIHVCGPPLVLEILRGRGGLQGRRGCSRVQCALHCIGTLRFEQIGRWLVPWTGVRGGVLRVPTLLHSTPPGCALGSVRGTSDSRDGRLISKDPAFHARMSLSFLIVSCGALLCAFPPRLFPSTPVPPPSHPSRVYLPLPLNSSGFIVPAVGSFSIPWEPGFVSDEKEADLPIEPEAEGGLNRNPSPDVGRDRDRAFVAKQWPPPTSP